MMVTTPEQADARMLLIVNDLPPEDGVREFTRVYLLSRQNVLTAAQDGYFVDPDYIRRLDVAFVNRFLQAYEASLVSISQVPQCWRPLFQERTTPHVRPVQHTVAGLLAHIHRDLVWAVHDTEKLRHVLENKSFQQDTHWPDFNRVNDVLEATLEDQVLPGYRASYDGELLLGVDALIAGFSIRGLRLDAWDRGNTLKIFSSTPFIGNTLVATMDNTLHATAELTARAALVPIPVE